MLPVYLESAYNIHRQTEEIAIEIINTDVIPNFPSQQANDFNCSVDIINRYRRLKEFPEILTRILQPKYPPK